MDEEDFISSRFAGRTYSRTRQSRGSEDGNKNVPVKAAMSLSKWGKTKIVPYRESLEGPTDVKRAKVTSKAEDPFSFDTEDKRKTSPVKREVQPSESSFSAELPVPRKIINSEEMQHRPQATIRTYSRTTPKKPVSISDMKPQLVGKTGLMKPMVSPQKNLNKMKDDDSDDEIFPVQFKREPLKTYTGDVVTPVDKPDSPPPSKKSSYKRKGGPRGRKPLTVSDPGLIEEYKRNYAAEQLKLKPDYSTGGLNNSMVVSKEELSNEDQGTTLVVVCKPKSQIENPTEVTTKYFAKSVKTKNTLTPVTPDLSASQQCIEGNDDETSRETTPSDITPTRSSARLRTPGTKGSSTSDVLSSPSSASGASASSSTRMTRGRLSGMAAPKCPSSDGNSQSEGCAEQATGKRYRIFKSRTPQTPQNDDQVLSFQETEELQESNEDPLPESEELNEGNQVSEIETETMAQDTQFYPDSLDIQTPEASSQNTVTSETAIFDMELDPSAIKEINPTAARELLAARLRNKEKNNDSDSTNGDQDNVSESSEGFQQSQESLSASQKSSVEAPRRFFKSKKSISGSSTDLQRKMFSNSPQKSPAKAVYNARSWYSDHDTENESVGTGAKDSPSGEKEDIVLVKNSEKGPKLKREVHWPQRKYDEAYTSLKVNKTHKELYTVVHNVKQTHEVQELGETQDFIDDVNYLLESLRDTNSTSIRCLSCLKLAGKCISAPFRMHMRAHGTVTKIFSLLHDACTDPSLALSTSTMMFMMSRDRLDMDLDQEGLKLMLRLNEIDAADKTSYGVAKLRDLEKTKTRVQELLTELQQELQAREIDLGFVSTGNLAMESLLSLTSRRAGEWFKEELRSAGGLDHIVDSVERCTKSLPTDITNEKIEKSLPVLRKLDRCLRVLENISCENIDNQSYLISYKGSSLLKSCAKSLSVCQSALPSHKVLDDPEAAKDLPGYTLLTCMLAILRVLLNVTHEHKLAALGQESQSFLMEVIFNCLLSTQWCIPVEQRFDLAVLCLGLLINMVENCKANRKLVMEMMVEVKEREKSPVQTTLAVEAVVELFVQREAVAHEMEEDTVPVPDTSLNKSGEWKESDSGIQWITNSLQKVQEVVTVKDGAQAQAKGDTTHDESTSKEGAEGNQSILEEDEDTFTKALHKAGKHMENSIVASYAGLLIGTLIMDNKEYAATVKELVPNGDFEPMIKLLKKFLNFMSLTTAFGSTDVNGISKVIEVLESA